MNKENVKLLGDPARIRKQGDIVEQAVAKLQKRSELLHSALGPEGNTTLALKTEVGGSTDAIAGVCRTIF